MKRLVTLLMTLTALVLGLPLNASADTGKVLKAGDRIMLSDVTDGTEFLLEGASETASNGKYLPQLPTSNEDRYITASLDSGSIYRFVKATGKYETNQYTHEQQWWIQNVKTGGYVTRSDAYYILKDDKYDATLFVLHSSDTLQSKFGTVAHADVATGFDNSSITICIPQTDSTAIYINNHYFVTQAGNGVVRAWSYQDTNPWNLRVPVWSTSYVDQLKAYYENFPESELASYAAGTNPGFLKDQTLVDDLNNAYSAVTDVIEDITDEDQAKTLLENLKSAYDAANDSSKVVPIPDEGYFYIKVADPDFAEKQADKEYAMCPYTDNQLGWLPFTDDYKFIWHFQKKDSGYVIKNASTGVYIDQPESIDLSVPMLFSKTNQTVQRFINYAYNGTFLIVSQPGYNDALYFNMNGHSGGTGTKGNVVTWSDANDHGSRWKLEVVPDDIIAAINNNPDLTALKNLISTCPDTAKLSKALGTNPFQYGADAYNSYVSALTAADDLVANTGTSEEYKAAQSTLQAALTALNASRVKLAEGYYKVICAYPQYFIQQKVRKAMSCNTTQLTWGDEKDKDASQIWKITPVPGDSTRYIAQNVMNSYYMGRPAERGYSKPVASSAEPDTIIVAPYSDNTNQVRIFSVFEPSVSFHTNGHGGGAGKGSNIVTWNTDMDGASSWIFETAELPSDLATSHLKDLLPTAEKTLSKAYAYTYNASSPYVTAATQLFGVNQEANEGKIETLIDGVKTTDNTAGNYFHSSWSGSVKAGTQPGDTLINTWHAIGVKAGDTPFPDPMVIAFTTRSQNSSLAPTIMNVMASADSITWTQLATVYNTTSLRGGMDWNSAEIKGASAYKYVRMDVVETYTNSKDKYSHPYFALTEFNLYPSTGLSAAAEINDADVKTAADALSALIEADKAKVAAVTATEDDVTALQEAVDKLAASYRDTTKLSALMTEAANLDLTVGSELGNVSQDAYDAFHSAVDPLVAQRPLYTLTKAQIAANTEALENALKAVRAAVVLPDGKTWYFIVSADNTRSTNSEGQYVYQNSNVPGTDQPMKNQTISQEDLSKYARNAWVIESKDNKVYLRNVGNGLYQSSSNAAAGQTSYNIAAADTLPTKDAFILIPLGDEQYAFKAADKDFYLTANSTSTGNVTFAAAPSTSMKNTQYAFTLASVKDIADEVNVPQTSIRKGSYKAFMLPVPVTAVVTDGDASFKIYEIVGKTTNDNLETTAINLKENTLDEAIPAGHPFILYAEGDYTSGDMTGEFSFVTDADSQLKFTADTVNGLIGVANALSISSKGLGYIDINNDRDKVTPTNGSAVTIGVESAYINPALITETGETVEATIEVKGSIINAVNAAKVAPASAKVNVYTLDGVLVKKGVSLSDAVTGLKKGIYLIGKKKVLIR